MKKLTISRLDRLDHLVSPYEFSDWTEQSPVLSLMEDFRVHPPHTVRYNLGAAEASRQMTMEGVTGKLVADQHGELVGLLTDDRLSDQSFLIMQATQRATRQELTVADMMQPRAEIPVLEYDALQSALVGDLVRTLRETGEAYCLVLDRDKHHIRGLISLREIAERLHKTLDVQPKMSIAKALFA